MKLLTLCSGTAAQAAARPKEIAGQMCQCLKEKVDEEEKKGEGQRWEDGREGRKENTV